MPTLFLSAGVPDPHRDARYVETARADLISAAVTTATRFILAKPDGLLRFGGHPSILDAVVAGAEGSTPEETGHRWSRIQLFLSSYFKQTEPDPRYRRFQDVIRWVDPPVERRTRADALDSLRRAMLATPPDLALFIGGMEGVEEEFALCQRFYPAVPRLPMRAPGGAGKILFDLWRTGAPPSLAAALASAGVDQLASALELALADVGAPRPEAPAPAPSRIDPSNIELLTMREAQIAFQLRTPAPGQTVDRIIDSQSPLGAHLADLRSSSLEQREDPMRGRRPRVFLLPGLMGSTLGVRRTGGDDDVLWFNPLRVAEGRFDDLSLEVLPTSVSALELMPLVYTPMRLALEMGGFEVLSHPFDWRLSLGVTGRTLADVVREEWERDSTRPIHFVCHSMGCLVMRAALRVLERSVVDALGRIVFLAPPNLGSWEALRALEGSQPLVVALKTMAQFSDDAGRGIPASIQSFDGLYELLPDAVLGLPSAPPPLRDPQLEGAGKTRAAGGALEALSGIGDRLTIVAGAGIPTRGGDSSVGDARVNGDGTVPLDATGWSEIKNRYFIVWEHGSMAAAPDVLWDVKRLLDGQAPSRLTTTPAPLGDARAATTRTAESAVPYAPLRSFIALAPAPSQAATTEHVLEAAVEPVTAVASLIVEATSSGVALSGGADRRVVLRCVAGSLSAVPAAGWIVLHVAGTELRGGLREIDLALEHALRRSLADPSFLGSVREPRVIPTALFPVPTSVVILSAVPTGIPASIESGLRVALQRAVGFRLREVGVHLPDSVEVDSLAPVLLAAVFAAADSSSPLTVSFCVSGDDRCEALHRRLRESLGAAVPVGASVDLRERWRAPTTRPGDEDETPPRERSPIYLRVEEASDHTAGTLRFDYSLFGGSIMGATVATDSVTLGAASLEELRRALRSHGVTGAGVAQFGVHLGLRLLPENTRRALLRIDRPLVVLQDRDGTRIPWEPLALDELRPALTSGLSRMVAGVTARRLEQRPGDGALRVLAVIDPEEELPAARAEGERLRRLGDESADLHLDILAGRKATLEAVTRKMASGEFDVMHFAGHASFDVADRAAAGLRCAGGEVLGGAVIGQLTTLPPLLVFNACETARVRAPADAATVAASTSVAEGCLLAGVYGYVGTYWPVGDAAAAAFAEAFYRKLVAGQTVSDALVAGRRAVQSQSDRPQDWADYMHYGNPNLTIRSRKNAEPSGNSSTRRVAAPCSVPVPSESFPYSFRIVLPFDTPDLEGILTLEDGKEVPIRFNSARARGSVPARPARIRLLEPTGDVRATRPDNRPDHPEEDGTSTQVTVDITALFAEPGFGVPPDGRLDIVPKWEVVCHEENHKPQANAAPGRSGTTRFGSWEHIQCALYVGYESMPDPGFEHLAKQFQSPARISRSTPIPLDASGRLRADFGEIICLAGDFYAHLDAECAALFADAWPPASGGLARFADADYRQETLWGEDPRVVDDILRRIHRDVAVGGMAGGEPVQLLYDAATGRYPVRRYLTLAAFNMCHFGGPQDALPPAEVVVANEAKRMYERYHQVALDRARKAGDDLSAFYHAVATEAFACHFLTDLFASGHMRTPRRRLYERFGVLRGSLRMSKEMHDEDNKAGLWVRTRHRDKAERLVWQAFGDGSLLEDKAATHLRMVQTAVQVSVAEVFHAAHGTEISTFGASVLIPVPIEPGAEPAEAGKNAADPKGQWTTKVASNGLPLYLVNSAGGLEKRRRGAALTDYSDGEARFEPI